MRIRLSVLCIAILAIAACRVKDPPDVSALKKEAMPTVTVPLGWTTIGPTPELVVGGWIASFGDQQLSDAVTEGIANNPDLRVGAARVEEALLSA